MRKIAHKSVLLRSFVDSLRLTLDLEPLYSGRSVRPRRKPGSVPQRCTSGPEWRHDRGDHRLW